ncbi:hypothetical protein HaLaN_32582 [Haematococcus lacustris]|uniref:Uncharacterized protein n=1 Tax=Haematococcus lacustris TaxID=44745 RepID=A0A6A0AKG2_HAELA|nr:hypothetical protein HaLaN_32582 [Haematococcus lacustris]
MAVQSDEADSDSEDEEEGSRHAAADLETTLGLAATADAVVRDLHSRFLPPEHAIGLAVVYAHYWDKQPSDENVLERQAIFSAQQSAFVEVLRCQADHRVQLSSTAANPAEETTKLWRYLDGQPITKANISELSGGGAHVLSHGIPQR